MRFGSTTEVLAKGMLKYNRMSWCEESVFARGKQVIWNLQSTEAMHHAAIKHHMSSQTCHLVSWHLVKVACYFLLQAALSSQCIGAWLMAACTASTADFSAPRQLQLLQSFWVAFHLGSGKLGHHGVWCHPSTSKACTSTLRLLPLHGCISERSLSRHAACLTATTCCRTSRHDLCT